MDRRMREWRLSFPINGMLQTIADACDPAYPQWSPYRGDVVNLSRYWAMHVMRMARNYGLYPTTAQLDAETHAEDGEPCEYGCDCDACQSAGERGWIRRHQFT